MGWLVSLRRLTVKTRWSAVTDLGGVELIEDRQGGLADPLACGLDDLDRFLAVHPRSPGRHVRDRVPGRVHPMGGADHQRD